MITWDSDILLAQHGRNKTERKAVEAVTYEHFSKVLKVDGTALDITRIHTNTSVIKH